MAMEDRNQVLCTQGEDFYEGIAAFLEKRAAALCRKLSPCPALVTVERPMPGCAVVTLNRPAA